MLVENESLENEARVQRDIVDSCVSHYEVFNIANGALLQASSVGSSKAMAIDSRLCGSISSLDAMSKRMLSSSAEWRSKRVIATTAVSQSYRLVELLEAPQTLEACLASEAYHEALLVVDHVRSMQEEFPQSTLLQAVSKRVDQVLGDGVVSLVFPKLSQAISLTTCIKLINFLRRLDVPDFEIRQLFLNRKLAALDTMVSEAARAGQSAYSGLSKAISAFKVNISEIILRYEACFNLRDDVQVFELQGWVQSRASSFCGTFSAGVQVISSGAELASLANQVDHLSPSLGRVSVDVTSLLVPILSSRAEEIFMSQLRLTKDTYAAAMGAQMWNGAPSSHQKGLSDSGVPMQLLHYLPLAYVTNGILAACNEIRKCAFSCIVMPCEAAIDDLLAIVAADARGLLQSNFLSEGERVCVLDFQSLFKNVLLPHVSASIRKLFPNAHEGGFQKTLRAMVM